MSSFCNCHVAIREARTGSFDVLLTDKNLGRHRGIEPLLRVMQEERPSIPVIISSAEDGTQARKELYCHDYIEKDVSDFLGRLQAAIKRYQIN